MALPEKIKNRFNDFADYQVKTMMLISVTVDSFRLYPQQIKLMKAVQELERSYGKTINEDRLKQVREREPIVKEEAEKGFPFFHGMASVGIWGSLEALIEDELALCIEANPKFLERDQIQRIKIPFSQFNSMTAEERIFYVIDSIERETQSKFKQGISQFEFVLDVFGLSGEVPDITKKTLLELCNVRNVIVHRGGIADKRLLNICPWLNLTVGDPVYVDARMFFQYLHEVGIYGAIVFRRIINHFSDDPSRIDKFITSLGEARRHYTQN